MKRVLVITITILVSLVQTNAQTIWNRAHIDNVKASLDNPVYAAAYRQLINDADSQMKAEPVSVMFSEPTISSKAACILELSTPRHTIALTFSLTRSVSTE